MRNLASPSERIDRAVASLWCEGGQSRPSRMFGSSQLALSVQNVFDKDR